jgi:hypothetical protein
MNIDLVLPPVEHAVTVTLAPAQAFALFTQRMDAWWPLASHSCGGAQAERVLFDGWVGGAVTEITRSGERHPWGTLTEWDPPRAFAMSWHPGLEAVDATRLRVTFAAVDSGTEVRVVHGGWEARGSLAAKKRDQYDQGWPVVLAAYTAVAAQPQG